MEWCCMRRARQTEEVGCSCLGHVPCVQAPARRLVRMVRMLFFTVSVSLMI
jgi:hypothetical protein